MFLSRSDDTHDVRLIFVTFFAVWTLSFMGLKHSDPGYLVNATPLTVLPESFLKICSYFCQGLKMFMAFICNPQIMFLLLFDR